MERGALNDVPAAKRIRRMLRALAKLRDAGQPEEARKLAEWIREKAESNPQMLDQLNRMMNDRIPGRNMDRREGPNPPEDEVQ